jgi:NAD(P)-dependent dehydrogenase (short-subunit alcohol dehydrogenase family)
MIASGSETMNQADRFSLAGKVALVLGGSSGIGREIAVGFHAAGATVVPVGKTAAKVAEVERALAAQGATAKGHTADVTQPAVLRETIARVLAAHGRIDILVNSQGTTILKPAEDFTREDFDLVMATNLTSVFFACTEIGRHTLQNIAAHKSPRATKLYDRTSDAITLDEIERITI